MTWMQRAGKQRKENKVPSNMFVPAVRSAFDILLKLQALRDALKPAWLVGQLAQEPPSS